MLSEVCGMSFKLFHFFFTEYSSRVSNWNFGAFSKSKRMECSQSPQNGTIQFLCSNCFAKLSFFFEKKMELINDVWFQLLDCLNWRVANDIDNILAVSSSFT